MTDVQGSEDDVDNVMMTASSSFSMTGLMVGQ